MVFGGSKRSQTKLFGSSSLTWSMDESIIRKAWRQYGGSMEAVWRQYGGSMEAGDNYLLMS